MIKTHTAIIKIPASEKKEMSYETTDEKIFDSKWKAESHQRLVDALKIRDALSGYNGWFRVHSQTELASLWLCQSSGRWWDSQGKHCVSFPAWVQVSAYQDQDRYWHTEIIELTNNDLRIMSPFLVDALCVITQTPHILEYLSENALKALEQCLDALDEY